MLTNNITGRTSSEVMRNAVHAVVMMGLSLKKASLTYNITRTTSRRYYEKCKNKEEEIDWNSSILEGAPRLTPNYIKIYLQQKKALYENSFYNKYSYNDNIFGDDDFLAASVTDVTTNAGPTQDVVVQDAFVSPQILKPFPTVAIFAPAKIKERKKKTTEILTERPVMKRLELECQMKAARKSGSKQHPAVKRKICDDQLHIVSSAETIIHKQKTIKTDDTSTTDEESDLQLTDSDDIDYASDLDSPNDRVTCDLDRIKVDSFVLVRFPTKKTIRYYVGCLTDVLKENEFNITFLRRHGQNFTYSDVPDTGHVLLEDIVLHLSQPVEVRGTARSANVFKFPIDFSLNNVS
ncbi:hypothetical protein FQA39_LY01443 [Lamprigera yunnana]|nr:hypothetical protein FQA39_LY01443 [Lamprigera yunnana]